MSDNPQPVQLLRMRGVLDRLSEQIECNTCDLCEDGAVYLLNIEIPLMKHLKIPLINIDGSYFFKRTGKYCPAYNQSKKRCTIYSERPICCRLFPMDIFVENEKLKWIVFTDCPIIEHKVKNESLDSIIEIAKEFEKLISKDVADEFTREYHAWKKTGDPFLSKCHIKVIRDCQIEQCEQSITV
jgi:Fe-S-cluster containining protein